MKKISLLIIGFLIGIGLSFVAFKVSPPLQALASDNLVRLLKDEVENLKNQLSQIKKDISVLGEKVDKLSTLEAKSQVKQVIYQGKIDIEQSGDEIVTEETIEGNKYFYHWKVIEVPEIQLAKMPQVKIYLKPHQMATSIGINKFPKDGFLWYAPGHPFGFTFYQIGYDEGKVYIAYKGVSEGGEARYYIDGEYKIVVTYVE